MRGTTWAAVLAAALLLGGCGDDDESSGSDQACLAEIKRQMADTSQATDDVPAPCKGLSDERLAELGKIAIADGFLGASPSPRPTD